MPINKNYFFFLVFLSSILFFGGSLIAQDLHRADSLQRIFSSQKTDNARWSIANEISNALLYTSAKKSKAWCDTMQKYALRASSKDGIAVSENQYGSISFYAGDYNDAITHFLKSIKLSEELKHEHKLGSSLNNLGSVYLSQQDYPMAIKYLRQALSINFRVGSKEDIADNYFNIGSAYLMMNSYDSSLFYLEEALKMTDEVNSPNFKGQVLANMGSLFSYKHDFAKALVFFGKAENSFNSIHDTYSLAVLYNSYAEVFTEKKEAANAIVYANKALELAKKEGLKDDIKNAYDFLSRAYALKNDYFHAYSFHRKFTNIKDSLLNEENSRQLHQMQTIYETEKKDKELLKKDSELTREQAKSERQSLQRDIFIGGFVLMGIFVFFILRSYRQKKKAHLLIKRQKEIVEEKQKEILDSIHYARRIQRALITNEKYISKNLVRLNSKKN